MITSNHTLSYCELCDCKMVICAHCGNNCCNAATKDTCPDQCNDAYIMQTLYRTDKNAIQFIGTHPGYDERKKNLLMGHDQ